MLLYAHGKELSPQGETQPPRSWPSTRTTTSQWSTTASQLHILPPHTQMCSVPSAGIFDTNPPPNYSASL